MTINWHEVTFANATISLRSGEYDLFGSSASYTVPRATVCNYVGPLWSKGSLAVIRKADAAKLQTMADLNNPDVTIAVNGGSSDEQRMPLLFPKAKFMAVAGQYSMAAEPVRGGRATACIVGDTEAYALAKRNPDWAVVLDPSNSFDKRPNTWMIRYGDVAWKNFLDTWCAYVAANGQVQRLYDKYAAEIL
jgi:ABC-type amino acid transport substrate-binding protein